MFIQYSSFKLNAIVVWKFSYRSLEFQKEKEKLAIYVDACNQYCMLKRQPYKANTKAKNEKFLQQDASVIDFKSFLLYILIAELCPVSEELASRLIV